MDVALDLAMEFYLAFRRDGPGDFQTTGNDRGFFPIPKNDRTSWSRVWATRNRDASGEALTKAEEIWSNSTKI